MPRKSKKESIDFDVTKHILVPEHTKLSEKERKVVLEKYGVTIKQLPKIYSTDPAIQHLDAKVGDVIKIVKESPTAGRVEYYRGVISA